MHPRGRLGKKEEIRRHKLFLELLPESRTAGEAYLAAGFKAETSETAHQNACRLIRKLDAKLGYREIMDQVGLTDRYVATKIKDVVDADDGHLSVKGLNLTTRCKGWQQPNVNVGVGVSIIIGGMSARASSKDVQDADIIDVTPPEDESEQIQD